MSRLFSPSLLLLLACTSGGRLSSLSAVEEEEPAPTDSAAPDPDSDEPDPGEPPPFEAGEALDPAPGPGPDLEDVLYSEDAITPLGLSLSGDALDDLRRNPEGYVEAELIYGEATFVVGVRIKGSSTRTDMEDKPSLIVDANRFVAGQEFMGHKKFNLHNQLIDPSMMSEIRSYRTLRENGLPASRAGYVRLTINGEDYGLYTSVQPHNDDFLEDWYTNPDGNLYENGGEDCDFTNDWCFEREENDEGGDAAFDALVADALLEGDAWETAMRARLDWPLFIKSIAMDAVIAHWDGYAYDRSNYHIYHDPVEDKWSFIPQSMDLDYGWRPWSYDSCGRHGVDPNTYTEGILAKKCLASATCRPEYVAAVMELTDAWEAADPVGQIDTLYALIADEVYSDGRKHYSSSSFERHVTCVRDWVEQRPAELREWAAAEGG
jgi:hypothetical protein